jgi:hypothetical protein
MVREAIEESAAASERSGRAPFRSPPPALIIMAMFAERLLGLIEGELLGYHGAMNLRVRSDHHVEHDQTISIELVGLDRHDSPIREERHRDTRRPAQSLDRAPRCPRYGSTKR